MEVLFRSDRELMRQRSLKDYETVFRDHFHFRKNLDQKDWESIAHRIEQRRRDGKASIVFLDDRLLAHKRVQRGTRKYNANGYSKAKLCRYLRYDRSDRHSLIATSNPTHHLGPKNHDQDSASKSQD